MKVSCRNLFKTFLLTAISLLIASCAIGGKRHDRSQDLGNAGVDSSPSQAQVSQANESDKPQSCPSTVTLDLKSSNYRGLINIEFRNGKRPGSKRLQSAKVNTSGTVTIVNVCAGKYFFAFSTPDSPSVSVTSYFDVVNNGRQYSNPRITVTYTRSPKNNVVQTVGRGSL